MDERGWKKEEERTKEREKKTELDEPKPCKRRVHEYSRVLQKKKPRKTGIE